MSPISSVGSTYSLPSLRQVDAAPAPGAAGASSAAPAQGFGKMLDNLVASVDAKQAQADQITQSVLMGDSGQLHQSVIAMQEASLSFSLMVQVRNKLVESYQELMRMQA
jgi:flagellar hook-basal body complex protein FliE